MSGNVSFAALMPHPPIVVSEVGGGREAEATSTVEAMARIARELVEVRPEAVVVISPHSPRRPGAFGIWGTPRLRGSFARFGAPEAVVDLPNDLELAGAIGEGCERAGLVTWRIGGGHEFDHGACVPLWFLGQAGWDGPTVVISLNYPGEGGLESLGEVIAAAAARLGRRTAVIASGDMSHRLKPGAPSGFHPDGQRFDEAFVALLETRRFSAIADLDPILVESAGEDVVDSTRVALAAVGRAPENSRVLSYEGPFGVGYCVAVLHEGPELIAGEHAAAREPTSGREGALGGGGMLPGLARASVVAALGGDPPPTPDGLLADPFTGAPAPCFVTIRRRDGALRGCVGTIAPRHGSLVEETVRNARAAAFDDARFPPVESGELDDLVFEVSVLHDFEPAESPADLDPARFGVIVTAPGGKRALMLPGVPGLDTVEAQLAATRRKAGIAPDEPVRLERFRTTVFHEPEAHPPD